MEEDWGEARRAEDEEEKDRPFGVGATLSRGKIPLLKADVGPIRPADDAGEWVNAAAPRNARGSSRRVVANGIIVAPIENETVCRQGCVSNCEMCWKLLPKAIT